MRFGVAILTGTRDLAILQGGNWRMSLKNIKDTRNSRDENVIIIGNVGNSQTMTQSTYQTFHPYNFCTIQYSDMYSLVWFQNFIVAFQREAD